MAEKTVKIEHETGLHARPAALFVQTANKFKSDVFVQKDDRKVNAKSMLEVLSLGAGKGSEVIISADGEDGEDAVNALVELIKSNFGGVQ